MEKKDKRDSDEKREGEGGNTELEYVENNRKERKGEKCRIAV